MVDQNHTGTNDGYDHNSVLNHAVWERVQGEIEYCERQIEEERKSCFMSDYHHTKHGAGDKKIQNFADLMFICETQSRCHNAKENENDTDLDIAHACRSTGREQQHHACKQHTDKINSNTEKILR